MASFLDPPADYQPPEDWVDPSTVVPPPRDEVEVGDMLKRRAQAAREAEVVPELEEDCEECRKKRNRARTLGVTVGTFIGGAAVLAVVYLLKGHDVQS